MDGFTVSQPEGLRNPVVIIAFTGWSDTGTVTTDAAQQFVDAFNAHQFMDVDPEDYYVFTDTRPTVRITEGGLREIIWPQNNAYAAEMQGYDRDLVIISGAEPNLRWRTFSERLAEVIADLNPSLVCTLVARPAATPHTRPIPVTGSSADAQLAARYGLGRSMYQGPTGVVGVIHDALRDRNIPLISLAAGVPHYLNVPENPPATMALLQAVGGVTGWDIPMGDLPAEGEQFLARVEEASSGDEQIAQYVRTLEEHYGEPEDEEQQQGQGDAELPSADDVLRDIEDFLRRGDDDDEEQPSP
ncbi:MAG: PAC2 family protein [Dehalococcoidia bacterium]|nr:PAC2 family protein [Dehalococcoidia bacterium]